MGNFKAPSTGGGSVRGTSAAPVLVPAVVLLAVAVALAGCVGGEVEPTGDQLPDRRDGGANPQPSGDANAIARGFEPPVWQVGDFWTYQMTGPGVDRTRTDVVVADEGSDWVVRSDDAQVTFFDARDDISTLGPQRKADLAGSQGSDRVEFLDWPLEMDKGWTTTWDDVERHIQVVGVADDRSSFELVAHGPDGDVQVEYTYEPAAKWFTRLVFHDVDGETFELSLTERGTGYDGTYLTVDYDTVLDVSATGPDGNYAPVTVGEGADDFFYEASYGSGSSGALGFGWARDDVQWDPTVMESCPCPRSSVEGTVAAQAGDWAWAYGTLLAPDDGHLDLTVFLRDFTEHSVETGGGDGGDGDGGDGGDGNGVVAWTAS